MQSQETTKPVAITGNDEASAALSQLIILDKTKERMKEEFKRKMEALENSRAALIDGLSTYAEMMYSEHGKQAMKFKHGQITWKAKPPRIELAKDDDGKPVDLAPHAGNPFVKISYALDKRALKSAPPEELPPFVTRIAGEMSFSYKANDEEVA